MISNVRLYKTPLDTNYSNVIDVNLDEFNITHEFQLSIFIKEEIFDKIYSFININTYNKSIKKDLLNSTLVVNKHIENIRDYNYCIITYDEGLILFYFITNITSENDNKDNPSSSLNLVYDVWTNNLYKILKGEIIGKVNTRHYDRIKSVNDGEISYYFRNLDIPQLDHKISKVSLDNRYKVLFCIYEFKSTEILNDDIVRTFTTNVDDTDVYISAFDSVFIDRYDKNLLYFPIGVLDTETLSFKEGTFTGKDFYYTSTVFNSYSIKSKSFEYKKEIEFPVINKLTPNVAKIYLSYYSPFIYNIDENFNVEFDCVLIGCDDKPVLSPHPDKILPLDFTNVDNYTTLRGFEEYRNQFFKKLYTDYFDVYDVNLNDLIEDNNVEEPQLNYYPFKFYSLSINKEQYPLVSSSPNDNYLYITMDYKTFQPHLEITQDNKHIYSPQGFYLSTNGSLSFSVDALQDYLIRNGSQEKTAINISKMRSGIKSLENMLKSLGSIYASATTGFKGDRYTGSRTSMNDVLEPLYKEEMYKSKIDDLSNTPDTYNCEYGECDILFQNRLQCYKYEVDKNNPLYLQAKNKFKYFGYSIENTENVNSVINRTHYDFIKCDTINSNLMLPTIIKSMIENIFIRGVYRNHFRKNISFNLNFNKDITNNEVKLYLTNTN